MIRRTTHSEPPFPLRRRAGRIILALRLAAGLALADTLPFLAADPAAPAGEFTPEFMRFTETGTHEGRLDTATKTYRRAADQVEVALIAVVHVGDAAYYDTLQRRFADYDAVLYEMIRDREADPTAEVSSDHPVSQLQIGMKSMLALEFQLDRIDYGATNLVHADLDPATFASLQTERGESILGLLFKAALEEQRRQAADPDAGLNPFSLLIALTSDDSARRLKFLLGRQMGQMEDVLAGLDQTPDGKGSAILSGRNEHAMKVLTEQIAQGRRKLAIFYGAGHMPDFEKRLRALGFVPVAQDWQTAWDVRKPKTERPRRTPVLPATPVAPEPVRP